MVRNGLGSFCFVIMSRLMMASLSRATCRLLSRSRLVLLLVRKAGGGGEADPIPLSASGEAQGDGQVGLTRADWPQNTTFPLAWM